jgi:hypothetical protein
MEVGISLLFWLEQQSRHNPQYASTGRLFFGVHSKRLVAKSKKVSVAGIDIKSGAFYSGFCGDER